MTALVGVNAEKKCCREAVIWMEHCLNPVHTSENTYSPPLPGKRFIALDRSRLQLPSLSQAQYPPVNVTPRLGVSRGERLTSITEPPKATRLQGSAGTNHAGSYDTSING